MTFEHLLFESKDIRFLFFC